MNRAGFPLRFLELSLFLWLGLATSQRVLSAEPEVDYARHIKPLLARHCLQCHGPQKAEGGLRLDSRQGAFRGGDSTLPVLVPGKPEESELFRRVTSTDQTERMPADGNPLNEEEIALLRRWIAQGARWPAVEPRRWHWAYLPPKRPAVPHVAGKTNNPIDAFVLRRLRAAGLSLSPAAAPEAILRRLSLSLVGLPPGPGQLDRFLVRYEHNPQQAVQEAVDRLLASPRFGERWARWWLDAARYADSHGFQRDDLRDLWPYRDWVIRAFNANMSFDRFTVAQLAGDLLVAEKTGQKLHLQRCKLPPPAEEQIHYLCGELNEELADLLVATGFHRCAAVNVEAGTDPEEERVRQVVDRVNTTGMVWLGVTMECAQCHDHKYDPFTMKDYYQLFAYFNNTPRETEFSRKNRTTVFFQGYYVDLSDVPKYAFAADPPWPEKIEGEVPIRHQARSLVMYELPQERRTHILLRGVFGNLGPEVRPDTPDFFDKLAQAPRNRLGLARWLVSRHNPLTARVIVNRLWAEMFGRGIVGTLEDFGTRGEMPTHPELLDWLAVEFVESGWNIKHMLRLMATSRTFLQGAAAQGARGQQVDPQNRLLWHFPRRRLDAEAVRDNALAVAGLLSAKMFGPPVRPPQPKGLWAKVGGDRYRYQPSPGEDRYRRGIYVIRRRTTPHPWLTAFDSPDRIACTVERRVSNTPLQALVLLNDPVFVEAAEALGRRMQQAGSTDEDRLRWGFRLATSRWPRPQELAVLRRLLDRSRRAYRQRQAPRAESLAWTDVAQALLNLDETISIP